MSLQDYDCAQLSWNRNLDSTNAILLAVAIDESTVGSAQSYECWRTSCKTLSWDFLITLKNTQELTKASSNESHFWLRVDNFGEIARRGEV